MVLFRRLAALDIHTGTHLLTEVQQRFARLVLG
jgi:hypothetical protein